MVRDRERVGGVCVCVCVCEGNCQWISTQWLRVCDKLDSDSCEVIDIFIIDWDYITEPWMQLYTVAPFIAWLFREGPTVCVTINCLEFVYIQPCVHVLLFTFPNYLHTRTTGPFDYIQQCVHVLLFTITFIQADSAAWTVLTTACIRFWAFFTNITSAWGEGNVLVVERN